MRVCMKLLSVFFIMNVALATDFVLMIPLYNEKNRDRQKEYKKCLEINLAHPLIKEIHVLYDMSRDAKLNGPMLHYLKTKNVVIDYLPGRQKFSDFFEIANHKYPNSNIIVANADIYFDQTLSVLVNYDLTNRFMALTRWEELVDGNCQIHVFAPNPPLRSISQDVWIFKTPIAIANADISIGRIGCDPYIAFEADKSGLDVFNPCLSIICHHVHHSGIRNYDKYEHYDEQRGKELCFTYLR